MSHDGYDFPPSRDIFFPSSPNLLRIVLEDVLQDELLLLCLGCLGRAYEATHDGGRGQQGQDQPATYIREISYTSVLTFVRRKYESVFLPKSTIDFSLTRLWPLLHRGHVPTFPTSSFLPSAAENHIRLLRSQGGEEAGPQ